MARRRGLKRKAAKLAIETTTHRIEQKRTSTYSFSRVSLSQAQVMNGMSSDGLPDVVACGVQHLRGPVQIFFRDEQIVGVISRDSKNAHFRSRERLRN